MRPVSSGFGFSIPLPCPLPEAVLGVGCMSGTSLDGLDMAAVWFRQSSEGVYGYELGPCHTEPLPGVWRDRLAALASQDAETYAKTHTFWGRWMGEQVAGFMSGAGLSPLFVASHGQTVFHQPSRGFTAQIGCGQTMVSALGCVLVTDFRAKDVALGGHGAPLVPLGEALLFPEHELLLNLGGFANVSYGGRVAFDVVPCNIVLNHVSQQYFGVAYDDGGRLAASGSLLPELLGRLGGAGYYGARPPKSLGWEWVLAHEWGELHRFAEGLGGPADVLRTYTEHIAVQLARSLRSLRVGAGAVVWATGGGVHNDFLRGRIAARLGEVGVGLEVAGGGLADFKEALLFGLLGLRTLQGLPTTVRSVTGARLASVTGAIHLPG